MTAGEQYTVSDGTSTQTLSAVQYGNGGPGGGGGPVAEAVLVVEATAAGKPQGPYCPQKR